MANLLVYIELVEGTASWASLLTLRQARSLSAQLGATIYAVLPCAQPPLYGENDIIAILSRQGADKVILMTHSDLAEPSRFNTHGEALLTAATQFPPSLFLIPEGPGATELAPRIATRLGALFVRNPRFTVDASQSLIITQPLYDETHVWSFSTVDLEHGVVAAVSPDPQQYARPVGSEEAEVVVISPGFLNDVEPPTKMDPVSSGAVRRERLVLAGKGVAPGAPWDAVRAFATRLKAELRVTGDAAGILEGAPTLEKPPPISVPELVLAFGVGGSPETLSCLAPTSYLVAINSDRHAPIFARAQLGLVAEAHDAVQEMTQEIDTGPPAPAQPETDASTSSEQNGAFADTIPPRLRTGSEELAVADTDSDLGDVAKAARGTADTEELSALGPGEFEHSASADNGPKVVRSDNKAKALAQFISASTVFDPGRQDTPPHGATTPSASADTLFDPGTEAVEKKTDASEASAETDLPTEEEK